MTLSALTRGFVLVCMASAVSAQVPKTKSVEGTTVYFISPKNGDTVGQTFTVQFGLKGMGIAPAGVKFENSGHHHLLIDTDVPADANAPLPTTDQVKHFGKGQTETSLELAPGKHTLQLVLGDQNHTPHNPPVVSKKITITVTK